MENYFITNAKFSRELLVKPASLSSLIQNELYLCLETVINLHNTFFFCKEAFVKEPSNTNSFVKALVIRTIGYISYGRTYPFGVES